MSTLHAPEAQASDGSTLPSRLGIYRIESQLGQGGMGRVYLAWDALLERHVAIKEVRDESLDDEVQRARFLREARAVARLDHPAIVRIHHVLERDTGDCLVMEYVAGRDLSKIVSSKEMDAARVIVLGREIAEGLAEAHAHGLVHRDLKPANVMVDARGRAKILDFGLAKTLQPKAVGEAPRPESASAEHDGQAPALAEDEPGRDDRLTRAGTLVGTVHAMSPEQATGGDVDHRSDLFALGSLLYELLCGEAPFRGSSMVDSLRRVAVVDPDPISDRVAGVPPELADLIGDLLAKHPDARPASTAQVVARLLRLEHGVVGSGQEPAATAIPTPRNSLPAEADPDTPTLEGPSPVPGLQLDPGRGKEPSTPSLLTLLRIEPAPSPDESPTAPKQTDGVDELKRLALRLLPRFNGQSTMSPGLGFVFERPAEAVAFALALHRARSDENADEDGRPPARIGLDLGEVVVSRPAGPNGPLEVTGAPLDLATCLAARARPGQTLLGRAAFDLARGALAPRMLVAPEVRWLAHGKYFLGDLDEPLEICEVGRDGAAPLAAPAEAEDFRRLAAHSEEIALGWRPATGQPVPRRPGWTLVERLGEGGFGEVWLARSETNEERVFKFCFEPERLRALKREVTLFRLLRENLGHRDDIARVLDWDFDEKPYFLESEYTEGGDLVRWSERRGGLASVPLATRLELVAEVSDALAAAHSVGVLHKDVKPRNVLVGHDVDGRPQARLTDFGVGLLTERDRLNQPGFTVLGFTEATLDDGAASAGGGTVQYMAPELIEGKPASIQADVYSLGVLLYQIVVGDFDRALAQGWRRDVGDPLLEADIAACVDGSADRRLRSPADLAERLRTLEARREERRHEEEAEAAHLRAQRRRRIAAWAGAAAAVLLLVVSVFAYQTNQAKYREQDARQQAEQRRRQAEDMIEFLLGDLRAELQPIGKLSILDQVGDQAMEYFAAVDQEDLSNEEVAQYAKALHQIGQVRFQLGKAPEAADAFEASLDMAKRLSARDPENTDWLFQLGQSHFWVGYLHWQQRELDAALLAFEEYRRISRALVKKAPDQEDWRLELAYSHSNIGQVLEELGRVEDAGAELQTATRLFEGLAAESPPSDSLRVELAHVYAKLGRLERRRGRLADALTRFRNHLDMLQAAWDAAPNDTQLESFVALAHGHVGDALMSLGEPQAALRSYLEQERIFSDLAAHDPGNALWRRELVFLHGKLARSKLVLEDPEDARLHLEVADRILEASKTDETARYMVTVAEALQDLSWAWLLLAEPSPGVAGVRAAEAIQQFESLDAELISAEHGTWRAFAGWLLGQALTAQENEIAAEKSWAAALAAIEDLLARQYDPRAQATRVMILGSMGRRIEAVPAITALEGIGYREPFYIRSIRTEFSHPYQTSR